MELFLAFAAVIVAIATLFIANVFNRRIADLKAELERKLDQVAQAGSRATAENERQLRKTEQDLSGSYRRDWQKLARQYETIEEKTAEISNRVTQLNKVVTATFADHRSRLGSLGQLAADLHSRDDHAAADTARLLAEADRQAAALGELQDVLADTGGHAAETLADLNQRLLALVREVELLGVDHADMRSQLRKWLDHSARAASAEPSTLIIPGFITAAGRAAGEILPRLYEAMLRAAYFEPVFSERAGPASVFYYLAWHPPNGQSPEQHLGDMLAASRDSGASGAGLTEFRSLLLAIRASGPAMVRIGPLIVRHSAEGGFAGTVLTAKEAAELDGGEPGSSPARWAERLGALGEDRVVDLAGWASGRSS